MQLLYRYIKIGIFVLIILLCGTIYFMQRRISSLNTEVSNSYENIKAFSSENSIFKDQNRVFKLTIEQLESYNDTILIEMNKIKDSLKIKSKQLKSIQYISSLSKSKDTLIFRDTIFRDSLVKIDTTISNNWRTVTLTLEYPNKIDISTSFKNESYIIVLSSKETIKPSKRFFLARWLQKKHIVSIIDIYEKSPYTEINKQRFIEIIKP